MLRNAFQSHSEKLIERERTELTAELDKNTFIHDPGQWLSGALCRALIEWRDVDEANALIAVASSLDSPIILQDTLDIAYELGEAQGQSDMRDFLRAHGFTVDS